MHVVTSKTSHMFVTSAHDQTKISAKHHLPLRQNDFPSQRLPFSPWHHTAPNRWQSPRICHLHAKVAHDILLHRGDIRLRNKILLLCSSLPNRRIHQLFNTVRPNPIFVRLTKGSVACCHGGMHPSLRALFHNCASSRWSWSNSVMPASQHRRPEKSKS